MLTNQERQGDRKVEYCERDKGEMQGEKGKLCSIMQFTLCNFL
jgi:hypothetical protein